jgi:trehalose utilization protein
MQAYEESPCICHLIFYFRPGDQAYPLYKDENLLKMIKNACLWIGQTK